MGEDDLRELAADIEANGLQSPIILWRDNREEANGSEGPFPLWLLDGRNRLAALHLLGINSPQHAKTGQGGWVEKVRTYNAIKRVAQVSFGGAVSEGWETDVDPDAYVLTANVFRRHLPPEKRRAAVAALRQQGMSVREIAATTGLPKSTVARDAAHVTQVRQVTGRDGKHYPASRPKVPGPPVVPLGADALREAAAEVGALDPDGQPEAETWPVLPAGSRDAPRPVTTQPDAAGMEPEPDVVDGEIVDEAPEPRPEPEPGDVTDAEVVGEQPQQPSPAPAGQTAGWNMLKRSMRNMRDQIDEALRQKRPRQALNLDYVRASEDVNRALTDLENVLAGAPDAATSGEFGGIRADRRIERLAYQLIPHCAEWGPYGDPVGNLRKMADIIEERRRRRSEGLKEAG